MPRMHLFEFHDLPCFPGVWRDVVTDLLRVFCLHIDPYHAAYPKLVEALQRCGATTVLDLCSGSSGPWERLAGRLAEAGTPVSVLLTDKYPHRRALREAPRADGIRYLDESVDAMDVPAHLEGFRTLFASFHHFRPDEARRILQDAVRSGAGIAVMEYTEWTLGWILASVASPPFFWIASLFVLRPFTLQHLFWIYLLPIPLLCTIWDSMVSCLRTYSPRDLEALLDFPGAEGFRWEIGQTSYFWGLKVTYLIGTPLGASRQTPSG